MPLPLLRAVLHGDPSVSRGVHVLVAALAALLPAGTLALGFYALARALGDESVLLPPPDTTSRAEVLLGVFGYVLLAPVVETAFLAIMVRVLREVTRSAVWLVGVPAVVFGALHGLRGDTPLTVAANIVVVTWSFLVFSHVFVLWSRDGAGMGYRMSVAVHALYNLLAVLVLMTLLL